MTNQLEKVSIFTFILASLLFSFAYSDLFPFSINPLFSKKTHHYSIITVKDDENRILSNSSLGIFLDYASSYEKSGIIKSKSINKMGGLIDEEQLKNHLIKELNNYPFLEHIFVYITNVSAKKSGMSYQKKRFSIDNPFFDAKAVTNSKVYKKDKYRKRIKNEALFVTH